MQPEAEKRNVSPIPADDLDAAYARAKDLFTHYASSDDLVEAARLFEALGGHASARAYLKRCNTLLEYQPGGLVEFGSDQGAPMKWRVIGQRGKMRLLLMDEIRIERAYNDLRVDTSWKDCTLRRWLNHDFLNGSFSAEERSHIVSVRTVTPSSPKFFTVGGFPAMDKIFILSPEELDEYLPRAEDRACGCWWWARMPGCNLLCTASIYEDGSLYDIGVNVNYAQGGVRPAMWVLLRV